MPQTKLPDNNLTIEERQKLVEDNINLARYFAHKLCKDQQLIDDCIQEGTLGLMRAARLYDEDRPSSFANFAAFEIQCAIRDFLYRYRTIRLPDDERSKINKYQTRVRQMEVENIEITPDVLVETAEEIGLSKDVHNHLLNPVSSLNAKALISDSDAPTEVGELIADTLTEDPIESMAYAELVEFISDFIQNANIADEKTKRIVISQMESFIAKAMGEDPNNLESFTSLVAKEYPELDLKSKEFDRHYTRISGVWRTQLTKLQKALSNRVAFI